MKWKYKKLTKLIDDTELSTHGDLELQGHWGKYLCVLVSGFLENAISAVYMDFVSNAASPHVTRYTLKHLESIQNPKAQRFVTVDIDYPKPKLEQDIISAYLAGGGRTSGSFKRVSPLSALANTPETST